MHTILATFGFVLFFSIFDAFESVRSPGHPEAPSHLEFKLQLCQISLLSAAPFVRKFTLSWKEMGSNFPLVKPGWLVKLFHF